MCLILDIQGVYITDVTTFKKENILRDGTFKVESWIHLLGGLEQITQNVACHLEHVIFHILCVTSPMLYLGYCVARRQFFSSPG